MKDPVFDKNNDRHSRTRFAESYGQSVNSPAGKAPLKTPLNSSIYFWLLEPINGGSEFLGWVGDAVAFNERFGEIPKEVLLTTPDFFGLKALPPGHLVALPTWVTWMLLDKHQLPIRHLDNSAA